MPDQEVRFLIAYLPLEFAAKSTGEQEGTARDLFENHGKRTRDFRNGLGLAVPSANQVESLRRSVRYLTAVERVRQRWRQHNLTDAQRGQLRERDATERTAVESALLKLYEEIRLPTTDSGSLSLDAVGMRGRPLQTTLDERKRARIHDRLMELLTMVHRRVFEDVAPGKIVELFRLGEVESAEPGIPTSRVVAGFFSFLGFPRLLSGNVVRRAIARGVENGLFGYFTGRPTLGEDGRYRIDTSQVAVGRGVAEDEIDLDSGFLILPAALPAQPAEAVDGAELWSKPEPGTGLLVRETPDSPEPGAPTTPATLDEHAVALSFSADRSALYGAWNAPATSRRS